jgi:hypothetical protein
MSFDLKIVNGDIVFENANLAVIRGKDKLVQDILKMALTSVGANPLQPWYGSFLSKTLIGSVLQTDIVLTYAKSQLQNSLETLKKIQNLQVAAGVKMSPEEQISFVKDISITRNSVDLRLYSVVISVINRAFGKVNVDFGVSNF